MRVLVTGGSGYLGSAIVRALDRAGHEPVVFARHATAAALPGRAIDGDIRDTRAVTAAASGVDAIVHSAALVALWRRDPSDFDAINVGGLQSALAAARANHLPRIVYTSSFLALPPADSPHALTANHYQRTKVAARDLARRAAADGLPLVTLYPGVIYGPGPATEGNLVARLMRDHLNGRLPGAVGPERIWSFTFADDVADAHVAALTIRDPVREYIVGGVNAPQQAIFEFLHDRRQRPLPRRIPYAIASAAGAAQELVSAITKRPPLITRGAVEIFRHDWPLKSDDAVRDLGLRATPLSDGLAASLAAL
ncbi:MAG TPA: NAD-dependent epimerase/dehydratase family protein [Vicinamibacterales bacterium]|jgi:farnesol dehydrogenase|nr:NAD-dependent epimerase/dehydratase family protein [Vicinamibacterales bacterium]